MPGLHGPGSGIVLRLVMPPRTSGHLRPGRSFLGGCEVADAGAAARDVVAVSRRSLPEGTPELLTAGSTVRDATVES
jgi:hypothetical protein